MSEPLPGAGEPRPAAITYHYVFPQASPCGALLAYKQNGNALTLITTIRDASVGVGRSVTAGGFWEVKPMLAKPADTMQDGSAELYREFHEELGEGVKDIIPYEDFADRVEYLWDGMARKGVGLGVHAIVQKTLRLTDAEFDAIMATPETSEQRGKVAETFLLHAYNSAAAAEADIRARLSDFKYAEEVDAVVRWYNKKSRDAGMALC